MTSVNPFELSFLDFDPRQPHPRDLERRSEHGDEMAGAVPAFVSRLRS